jgi:hypothetical protein
MQDLTQGRMDAKEAKAARMELQQQAAAVEDELRRNQSTFFVKQEQIGGRCVFTQQGRLIEMIA